MDAAAALVQMAAFAGYGFPKAHAAGYARVAYRMAYLKTHYPAEYMAARLAVWGGYYRSRVYMAEARHLGLDVRPPHVNHSGRGAFVAEVSCLSPARRLSANLVFGINPGRMPCLRMCRLSGCSRAFSRLFRFVFPRAFTLDPDGERLWMGLGAVRDLTRVTTQAILAQQPFGSLEDFLVRVHPQHGETVNLVKAGAFAGLGNPRAMLTTLGRRRWHGRHTGQLGLALLVEEAQPPDPTVEERAAWEREVLGQLVSVHPLELVAEALASYDLTTSDQLEEHQGQEVKVAGVRLASQRFRANGEASMVLVDMEDRAGIFQVLWRGAALRRHREALSSREPVVIRGRVGTDRQGLMVVLGREIQRV